MPPEEILARLEKDIRFKKPYGFMTGHEQETYEAELECLTLARRNIATKTVEERCGICGFPATPGSNFCLNCGQRILQDKIH